MYARPAESHPVIRAASACCLSLCVLWGSVDRVWSGKHTVSQVCGGAGFGSVAAVVGFAMAQRLQMYS
jgi:hypothetical protein